MPDSLTNVRTAIRHYIAGHKEMELASRIMGGGPADYYMGKIDEYVTALFERFAPFKAGDRVQLSADPDTNNHWRSSRHFLVPGACGEVVEADYQHGHFVFGVVFDRESWLDDKGIEHMAQSRHIYRIQDSILEKESGSVRG